jgi:hypothetical protein
VEQAGEIKAELKRIKLQIGKTNIKLELEKIQNESSMKSNQAKKIVLKSFSKKQKS